MTEKLRPPNSHLNSFQDYENSIKTYHPSWIGAKNIDRLRISDKAFQIYYNGFVRKALMWAEIEHPTDPQKRKDCAMEYRRQLEQTLLPQRQI